LFQSPEGGPGAGEDPTFSDSRPAFRGLDAESIPRAESHPQSHFVRGLFIVFIVIMVILAGYSTVSMMSLSRFISSWGPRSSPTWEATTSTGSAGAGAAGRVSGSSRGPTPRIASATAIDPQGDGQENSTAARLTVDGDQATSWHSEHYQTAQFSGLKKGLGLLVMLPTATRIRSVTISSDGQGGEVEVRSTHTSGLDGSNVVGSASLTGGTTVITMSSPVKTKQLVVWCTQLPKLHGEYRLVVSEITVR
jgi:hypothetical protein